MGRPSTEEPPPEHEIFVGVPHGLIEAIASRVAEILLEQRGDDPLMTVQEAADYLRTRPQRIYDLCNEGGLTPIKDGRRSLFRRSQIDGYLAPA